MPYPLLQIKDLQVDFVNETGTTTAVKNISIEVNRGEIVAIVGESGSGKSVTSLSILQLLPAPPARYAAGSILFSEDGQQQVEMLHQSASALSKIRGHKIAMIFQEPMTSLNPVFTCGQQVMEAIKQHQRISATEAKARTLELFEKVKLPNPSLLMDRYPHQLSGGQKQRVMIAMAMSCNPSLLICDEPTTALDVTVQKTILQLIRGLQETEKMGVIFITHDLGVVAEVADRAVVMYKGAIVEQGSTSQLFHAPQHPYTKGLLACRPILHRKGERLPVVSDFLEGKTTIVSPKTAAVPQAPSTEDILLKVENLNVWFPARKTFFGKPLDYIKAVNDVSFTVRKGETLGLVGESGCGKTTLGRTLLRLIAPTSGAIWYNGQHITAIKKDALKDLRRNIQIIFQDPYSSLNPRMTIGDAIVEPMKVHGILNRASQRKDRAMEMLQKVDLKPEHFNRYPHEFSGGQRQRIVIARALSLGPTFVVCDESVSALDVSVQAQILNLLNDLKQEFDLTTIFISHDLSVVRYISDRIMVMNKGMIEEMGDAEEVYLHPKQEYTKQLIASIPKAAI
ncbi:MAG: ABC transporter ATP-binding protein [Pseudobacter sp.]|uniref:ABC transporter ATP-binding protein n=1 Tax=Pseudobacter sp. TaxID=2045420 RepID=UPI003F81EBD5